MAVDTANKRRSCVGIRGLRLFGRPLADSEIDVYDRRNMSGLYSGLDTVFDKFFFWRPTYDESSTWVATEDKTSTWVEAEDKNSDWTQSEDSSESTGKAEDVTTDWQKTQENPEE